MKHIVFDLGHVLIDWQPELALRAHFPDPDMARDWMAQIDFHDWNRTQDGGRPLHEGLQAMRDGFGALADPLADYTPNFDRTIARPMPGTWQIAEDLKVAGHRMFAITNWSADNWPAAQRLYPRLNTMFEDIVVSGIERLLKPETAIYHCLLRRNDLKAVDCIFIDDSPANVAGAEAVGMDAILFTDAAALRDALTKRGIR